MAVAEPKPRVTRRKPPISVVRGRAFGLDVEASFDIPALGTAGDQRALRKTVCRELPVRELERGWRDAESEPAVELRQPGGRLFMSIRSRPDLGYRIWAPRHGHHLVSPDGTRIWSALPQRSSLGWQRLFFAQTLPLAAALQGLEVLHASAVGVAGRGVAFTAASGTGKSSIAAHLVAAGAAFLTDDVLAVESGDGCVLAHPGPARTSVASKELRAMTARGRGRLGPRVGSTDKPHLEPPAAEHPLPLALVYRVSRGERIEHVGIEEHAPPSPRIVLASSFLPYLRTRERMLNQLAICAALTHSVRVFDLRIPNAVSAWNAAGAVHEHIQLALAP